MYNCTDYAGNEIIETFVFIMSAQKVKSLKSLSLKSFFWCTMSVFSWFH